jgi:predicted AAA+ superfamily ATPase
MIVRENYIDKIRNFINNPVIKVITGIRRAGKSYFLKQVIDLLIKKGVSKNQILYIKKELLKFDFIGNYREI